MYFGVTFKFVPLLEREDEFCLIDGDLLLHKRLPIDKIDADIIFDVTEIKNSIGTIFMVLNY